MATFVLFISKKKSRINQDSLFYLFISNTTKSFLLLDRSNKSYCSKRNSCSLFVCWHKSNTAFRKNKFLSKIFIHKGDRILNLTSTMSYLNSFKAIKNWTPKVSFERILNRSLPVSLGNGKDCRF